MKNFLLGISAVSLLTMGTVLHADAKVMLKEQPTMIKKEGQSYIIPEGVEATYYVYTADNGEIQYCTATAPTELMNVNGTVIELTVNNSPRKVQCYSSTYFEVKN